MQRSIDGGRTWNASPLQEDKPYQSTVWALARDPRHSSSFFAGTSTGLFWTNDRGASWTRFEPALDESVLSLALDPSGRFLYAGTERGVFRLERNFEPCGAVRSTLSHRREVPGFGDRPGPRRRSNHGTGDRRG